MSIKEQSINTKNVIIASNESSNKKEEVPIKTSQSMNTESYEYFSQKITTKNNLTESSLQTSNQNAQNQLLQCTCAQNLSQQKNGLKCICDQGIALQQCTCGQGMQGLELKCICGQLNQNQKCTCGQTKCNCGLASGISMQKKVEIKNTKNTTTSSSNYNNASSRMQKISVQSSSQNKSAISTTKIHQENKETSINTNAKICNCGNRSDKMTSVQNMKKTTKVTKKKINLNKNNWDKRCVGQNNENLQIIAAEKPELLMQCVQDIKVIQEPRPVQILLPIVPNEIDYPLGLEIYGKEKKVLICPENVENLNVSKAYSKIEPHFENLDIGQTDNVHCEKTENIIKKKERYDNDLTMENGEIFVKGQKDFNKDNTVELTTKMNVKGKQKLKWNETNEAIKTTKMNIDKNESIQTFGNLYIENNVYNYQGHPKTKFSSDETNLESNEEVQYPAEYVQQNWNLLTIPMSGKPFTLEREQKSTDEYRTIKEDKITIKKSYETTDWNKKNNKRREVQINMVKRARKNPIRQQKLQPVSIKGKENNWNDIITQQNDTTLKIDKTEKAQEDFVLTHGEEVSISKEGEDILINDDYNIVEENYTRPIRANIQKVPDVSEESVSSEYDVLKGISKYMGQYQYKELVGESLKVKAQNIIINDISGKYPRRIESYKGLDENFEKISRDQYEQKKLISKKEYNNYNININVQKKLIQQNQKEQYDYSDQNEQEQEQDQEQNEQEGSNENENENKNGQESYEKDSNEPEDAQEPGQEPDMEPEEQENMDAPEDKDHIPEDEGQLEEIEGEQNVLRKEQYYYLKKNEEKNDSEPKDEIDHEQESNQNEEEEVKDTPVKNEQSSEEKSPKVYIKEITYTKKEETLEKKEPNLRYITLKKREEDENEQEEKVETKINEQIKNNNLYEEEYKEHENRINQYLSMPSKPVDEEHISRDAGEDEDNELDEELKKKEEKEEIKNENNKEEKEENIEQKEEQHEEQHEEEHVEENIEHQEEGQLEVENENEEEHLEQNQEEEHQEEHQEEHVEQNEEEHAEEHVEEHEEEHVEEHIEEHVEEHEEEYVEEHEEEENIEHNEEHEEGQFEEKTEKEKEKEEEHQEEHIEQNNEQNEQHEEEEHIEENKEKQTEQKVEEKMEQKEQKPEGQFVEADSRENNEEHSEEKIEQHIEEHVQENLDKQEESHKEELITENKDIMKTEKQNIEQEKEIHKENIQEKKEKVISISNIVAEAIKSEMKSQEELKGSQEIKINTKENISIKKSKLDPSDNYTKITSSKITQQPSGEKVITKTVVHQKIETSTSNENPMVFSFGQGSIETSKKNEQNINFGSNASFGQNQNGSMILRLENNLNSDQIQYESNYTSKSNMISSDIGLSGRYYFSKGYSSYTYNGRSMREPMDTIKGRKRMENAMKAGYEIDELNFGPRDSKRK